MKCRLDNATDSDKCGMCSERGETVWHIVGKNDPVRDLWKITAEQTPEGVTKNEN